ncbi:ABC transporter ATP-binding protein/permease [Tetragenococcus koreensis]|uniref:ABC transporter ATP-binding protein n=1 Tax=Tetragenococcus koreensis TaxID=290335 RepID=UPI001F25F21F|nr:ABC transporter ATP-binding protein [Tetragenococcus koreensis]MCF1617006.1 ABC transporter ATP-binding protein/permease [Tetragenococcus koreensis]MCF1619892.1 ABC transporter ATP-binding protein/permease [Tetragenococcus koreensis]MCF1621948.1 ABC transporter ATP-binding protein/permease [Tetragenococcus koreensis]MCF1627613.1 ABC transporter ATP-binding protein/permease [Tetragenococcus koreensis]MCF1632471.1 ABC transporter ATP-binding protein/permease [Tetragenococcus koreensis]
MTANFYEVYPTSWQTVKRLFSYLKNYKKILLLSLTMTVISTIMEVAAPIVMGSILNHLQTAITDQTSLDFNFIIKTTLLLAGLYILLALSNIVVERMLVQLSQSLIKIMRTEVSDKISKVPLSFFDQHSTGDLLSRITNDVEAIGRNVQLSVSQIVNSLLMFVGIIAMMLYISPLLFLVFFITVPLNILATRIIMGRSQKYFRAKSERLGAMVGYVEENFTGTDLIKAYNYQDQSNQEFKEYNDRLFDVSYRASFMAGVLNPVMTFIGNVAYVLIAIVGGLLIVNGTIMVGDVLAFMQYSQNIRRPIDVIAEMANTLQETIASSNRVFQFLDAPEEVEDTTNRIEEPLEEIELDHIGFEYEKGQPVIQDLSLTVKQGETVAIVGHTGAGKTTLVNLLLRFYDVTKNKIMINGINIRTVPRDNLRSLFGMVLQDTWLIQGTVYDNILYGNINATEDEVIQASKEAHANHFIETLPNGYQTVLNEDATNISQGQRQLLTIARAFVSDPAILILDEATSSVDTRTEQLIQQAMANLMKGRTNFVIAHRLSTIVDADKILVMDQGDIVEQGSHEELLAKNGVYAELYNSQFSE